MLRKYILLALILTGVLGGFGQNLVFDYNKTCRKAMELNWDLRTSESKRITDSVHLANPNNFYPMYVSSYRDVLLLMIKPDENEYERFLEVQESRINALEEEELETAEWNYLLADMKFLKGLTQLKFGDFLSGLRNIYRSYKLVNTNLEEFPEEKRTLKLSGLYNIGVENLPSVIRRVASLFGVRGDEELGIGQIQAYYEAYRDEPGVQTEAAILFGLVHKLNKNPGLAYLRFDSYPDQLKNQYLLKYLYANAAHRSGRNERAFELLNQLELQETDVSFNAFNYLKGKVMMYKVNPEAKIYLTRFLDYNTGEDYLKEINYYLALHNLIFENGSQFAHYVEKLESEGNDKTERDREALISIAYNPNPNPLLESLGLLLAGSYWAEAEKVLKQLEGTKWANENLLWQYKYLRSLYYSKLGQFGLAEPGFLELTTMDEDSPYPAMAALQLGVIFEQKQQARHALAFYEQCLELYDGDYYEWIRDLANKGLQRVSNESN